MIKSAQILFLRCVYFVRYGIFPCKRSYLFVQLVSDEGEVCEGVQDLCTPIHCVPMVPGSSDAIQENRDLSNLFKTQEHLSDLLARSRIWLVEFYFHVGRVLLHMFA